MTTHENFKAALIKARDEGTMSRETLRIGDILLRYIAVLEQVPNPSEAVKQAAADAEREFLAALRGDAGVSL